MRGAKNSSASEQLKRPISGLWNSREQRRADLRHFEILRQGPIIIYPRPPAGGTCYPICTFPASSECLIGISDAFSAFCLRVSVIFPTCSLYPQQKRAYSALHLQAWTYIYIYKSIPEGSYRVQSPGFPKVVYCSVLIRCTGKSDENLNGAFSVDMLFCCCFKNIHGHDFDAVDFGCLHVFMSCMTSTEFVVLQSNHKHTLKHSLRLMFMQGRK